MTAILNATIAKAAFDASHEYTQARRRFGPMVSAHEGWAILFEEVDELWTEVKGDKRDMAEYLAACRKEAVQVAAMALAFIAEVCDRTYEPTPEPAS